MMHVKAPCENRQSCIWARKAADALLTPQFVRRMVKSGAGVQDSVARKFSEHMLTVSDTCMTVLGCIHFEIAENTNSESAVLELISVSDSELGWRVTAACVYGCCIDFSLFCACSCRLSKMFLRSRVFSQ